MTLKSFKDIFTTLSFGYRVGRPMLPGSINNRRHYSMRLCSSIGAETATHFPMYHGVAQRSLECVIIAQFIQRCFYLPIRPVSNEAAGEISILSSPYPRLL